MNGKILWDAFGDIDESYIAENETFVKKNYKKHTAIILAAAIILLLSVCAYAAVKWFISFEHIFGSDIVEEYEQPIESSAVSEEGYITFSLVSAVADERIFYLLWQLDGNGTSLPYNCTVFPEIRFTEGTVDSGLGWFADMDMLPTEAVNSLTGYVISGWNDEMKHSKGSVHLDRISIPSSSDAEDFYVDLPAVIAQSEYVESEYKIRHSHSHEYFAEYQWLDVLAYDRTYIDLAVYEDGILTVVLRTKLGEVENAATPTLYCGGEPLELLSYITFNDASGYLFTTTEYRVAEEDIPNLYFHRKVKNIVYKTWLEGDWSLDFDIEPTMVSTVLKTASTDIEIPCSKISMSIKGDLPELESIVITLKDGSEVELIDCDPNCIVFQTPVEPEEIASVKYNGKELLG